MGSFLTHTTSIHQLCGGLFSCLEQCWKHDPLAEVIKRHQETPTCCSGVWGVSCSHRPAACAPGCVSWATLLCGCQKRSTVSSSSYPFCPGGLGQINLVEEEEVERQRCTIENVVTSWTLFGSVYPWITIRTVNWRFKSQDSPRWFCSSLVVPSSVGAIRSHMKLLILSSPR